jgi:hypothetical protein
MGRNPGLISAPRIDCRSPTFDAYRRCFRQPERRLIEIDLSGVTPPPSNGSVAVVLGSGRRVEFAWAELAQLATHRHALRTLFSLLEQA